jgi:hypothetical protein
MMDDETVQRARELRERGVSPRDIARSLGVRPAEVTELVRKIAAERAAVGPPADLFDCWVSAGWSSGLTISSHPEWCDPGADSDASGLVTALVTRRKRHRSGAIVCVYLADVYCLGVKNVIGPDKINERALQRYASCVFSGYSTAPIPAPIELVRDLVLGAVEYARGLGFEPHPDFKRARAHLGPWAGTSAITFGCDGKPFYIEGPYDDSSRIIRMLGTAA